MPQDICRPPHTQGEILGPKILNHDTFDFANSAITHPGTNKAIDKERSVIKKITMFTVDSRDRDYSTHPHPSKYVINLDDDIPDVITAELIDAHIPFKTYLINKSNAKFMIQIDNDKIVVELDHGDYNPSQLAQHIEEKVLQFVPMTIVFKVEYNEIKDKFFFYADVPFSFCLEEKVTFTKPFNTGKIMGFSMKTHDSKANATPTHSNAPYELQGEFRKNFDEQSYILLKITGFHVQHSVSQMIEKTFAIIPEQKSNLKVHAEFHTATKHFNPPIARLSKLQISFIDHNGQPVDFQNHDHYFTIRFESFKHTRKYATFLDIP